MRVLSLLIAASTTAIVCSAQPFPPRLDLGSLAVGDGFALNGVTGADDAGFQVAGIGDLNHDGFDDVAVAAIGSDRNGSGSGSVYVFFGFPAAQLSTVELDELDGTNGFRIDGLSNFDQLGYGVDGAGDVNGDEIDDLIVGSPQGDANNSDAGEIYLLFGRPTFPPVVDLSLLDGTDGARIDGIDRFDEAGDAVSGAGDINGDGLDDFLIGAQLANPNGMNSGQVYVGFGRTVWPATVELANLNGDTGFVLNGSDPNDHAGHSVSSAGDVNGDGLDDLLVGALFGDPNGSSSGETYLVFGREVQPAIVELEDLDGSDGVTLNGDIAGSTSGKAVSGIGDIDQDGFDDLLIGSDGGLGAAGLSYIVYGRDLWDATLELAELDGTNGLKLHGINPLDRSGTSVSEAGDFDGDGVSDFLIGAPFADPSGTDSGEAYVVFGDNELPADIELAELDGSDGVALAGPLGSWSGFDVASAGDFNGDGIGDVIIGGPEGNDNTGIAYVVFGRFESGITLGATAATCPGSVDLRAKGVVPKGELQIYRGSGRGESEVPSGPCAGSELQLENAVAVRTVQANERGQWLFSVDIESEPLCGTSLQLIDRSTCQVSNVTAIRTE